MEYLISAKHNIYVEQLIDGELWEELKESIKECFEGKAIPFDQAVAEMRKDELRNANRIRTKSSKTIKKIGHTA